MTPTKPTATTSSSTAASARTSSAGSTWTWRRSRSSRAARRRPAGCRACRRIPGIMTFRIDPDEFYNPTSFFIKRMKLAALDTVAHELQRAMDDEQDRRDDQRLLRRRQGSGQQVAHRERERVGADGQPVLEHRRTARWRAVLRLRRAQRRDQHQRRLLEVAGRHRSHAASTARLVLNRSRLNFGVVAQTIKTPPQVLQLVGPQRAGREAVLDGLVRPAVPGRVAGLRLRRRVADRQPGRWGHSVARRLRRVDPH